MEFSMAEKFYINYFGSRSQRAQNEFKDAFTQIMIDRKEDVRAQWKLIKNDSGEIIGYEKATVPNNPEL